MIDSDVCSTASGKPSLLPRGPALAERVSPINVDGVGQGGDEEGDDVRDDLEEEEVSPNFDLSNVAWPGHG